MTTTLLRLSVGSFVPMPPVAMPPPEAAPGLPLRIVMPDIDVVPFANTSKTRSIPLPSMIALAAPAPVMVTASWMSRSPVAARSSPRPVMVSRYVPAGTTMVSVPPFAFDAWIAARSVQTTGAAVAQFVDVGDALGLSAELLTVKVVAAWTGARLAITQRATTRGDQRLNPRRLSCRGVTGEAPSVPVKLHQSLPTGRAAA